MHLGGLDMALTRYKLGALIKQRREKYNGVEELPAWGVSREGFIPPKQDGADTSIYNVFYKNDFVFNPARMELNSIAFNNSFTKAICSSLYEMFYVSRTDIVLTEYLNLFIKRDEFARKCWFEAIGSARNYFRVANLSEFDIDLPPLPIQQKYVDVYNAMLANQQSYECELEDLKIVFESYMDNLRKSLPHEAIGQYIELCEEKNEELKYSIDAVRGVSIEKKLSRKSDPESKGKIEAVVKYAKNNFAKNRIFTDLDSFNNDCLAWLHRTGNRKIHETTKKIPKEVFALEKQYLIPVPKLKFTYPVNKNISYPIRKDNIILYKSNRYRVPKGTYQPGKRVYMVVKEDQVSITDVETGEIYATHPLCYGKGELIGQKRDDRDMNLSLKTLEERVILLFKDQNDIKKFLKVIYQEKPRYYRDQL